MSSTKEHGYIDVHVHPPTKEFLIDSGGRHVEAAAKKFGRAIELKTFEQMLEEYSKCGVEKLVLFAWDAETSSHMPKVANEFVAKVADRYPERVVGFASVDPHKKSAVKDLEYAIRDLNLRGLKLHPQVQAFEPNDRAYYPLYSKCVELGVPVTFHTGSTYWGAGLEGGGGVKLRFSDPMLLDDVAADFPELKLIMAHPGWPWQDEQLAVATHKNNVYVDLSGWSPKYFQPLLITYMTKMIPQKFLFGTDYPMLSPQRWLQDFETLHTSPEIKDMILRDNAKNLLKLK
ncbi:MAG: amidohydrolase family protein [Candidatus Bathyarchaeia archaeon]